MSLSQALNQFAQNLGRYRNQSTISMLCCAFISSLYALNDV